ncbi:hypothetical protein [Parabacteroides goldsteinii]|uniref:hypothetical protein n=1 Tax=Parabacteroides goldsteinii TaxID=328812 RepID=UPI002676B6E6|nr:hypothetical protein [Parabacteroides goldsteinii]
MNNIINIPNVDRDERIGSVFNYLIRVIDDTEKVDSDVVKWNFKGTTFFHPFFIAPLAIYKNKCEKKIECIDVPTYITNYFNLIGFYEMIQISEDMDLLNILNPYISKTYTPICQFNLCNSNVDSLQTILQGIIESQVKDDFEIKTPLSYFLGELICNINQHSQSKYGYIFSQFLKKEKCINICIADDGITIYGSYIRTKKYIDKIKNEAEALKLANEGYSTKDLPGSESRGFGLSTSKSMLVEGLKGSFFMFSGGAFHRHDNNGSVFVKLPESINWYGTIILMKIPIHVPDGFNYINYIAK